MKIIAIGAAVAATLMAQEHPQEGPQTRVEVLNRTVSGVGIGVGTGVGFGAGMGQTFEYVSGQMLGGSPVKGAPYSAEAVNETTQTLADGNKIVNRSSSMVYRDGEGRERREESIGRLGGWTSEGAPTKAVFISDPVAKVSYSLNSKSHTAEKMSAPPMITAGKGSATISVRTMNVEHGGTPGEANGFYIENHISEAVNGRGGATPKVENLGTQMIEGIAAEGTRTTITIPAGQIGNQRDINIVSERWYSPELQVTVMSKRSDPRSGETMYKLTNVTRNEPLHSLFEVPADYTISSPRNFRFEMTGKEPGKDQEQNQF